jgi:orotidine-5'-phosphate decarboxylase
MGQTPRQMSAKDRLILAVDTSNLDGARRIIDELSEYVGVFKIGLELFMSEGLAALDLFHEAGTRIFFDGKFLDIPNTVARATEAIARAGVSMFTVHASGGSRMLSDCAAACNKAAAEAGKPVPIILGVTVLTSISDAILRDELGVANSAREQVLSLAALCQRSGITGIVSSAEEVAALRAQLGQTMVLVTPGVRPAWADANDQSRVMTPAQALQAGSDYLVVGRPITAAANKVEAARRIIDEMEEALTAV